MLNCKHLASLLMYFLAAEGTWVLGKILVTASSVRIEGEEKQRKVNQCGARRSREASRLTATRGEELISC